MLFNTENVEIKDLSIQGLHGGEEDHVPDGVRAGEQHDAAVDADAQAARGGQTVFQSVHVIVVHHVGFLVALVPQLHLTLEPLLLVDGVVELGEGVAHFAAADEQLKPLGEPVILGGTLGQRGDVHGMHGDEGGLDELLLHLLVKALVQGAAPGGKQFEYILDHPVTSRLAISLILALLKGKNSDKRHRAA